MYKWMGITFGAGVLLILMEIVVARKKKEGFTAVDRQRCLGILWVTLFAMGLIWFLSTLSPD